MWSFEEGRSKTFAASLLIILLLLISGCGSSSNGNQTTESNFQNSSNLTASTEEEGNSDTLPPSGLQQFWATSSFGYTNNAEVIYYNFGANVAAAHDMDLKFYSKNSNEVIATSVVDGIFPSLAGAQRSKNVFRLIFKRTTTANSFIPQVTKFVDGAETWTREFNPFYAFYGFRGGKIFLSKDDQRVVVCWDTATVPNAQSYFVTFNMDGTQAFPVVELHLSGGIAESHLTEDNQLLIANSNSFLMFNALTGFNIGTSNSFNPLVSPSSVKLSSGKTIIAFANNYGAIELYSATGMQSPVYYGYIPTLSNYVGRKTKLYVDAAGRIFLFYAANSTTQADLRDVRAYQLLPDPNNPNRLIGSVLSESLYIHEDNGAEYSDFFDSDVSPNGDFIVTDSVLNFQSASADHFSYIIRFKKTAEGYELQPTLIMDGQVMKLAFSPDGGQLATIVKKLNHESYVQIFSVDQPSVTVIGAHLAALSLLVKGPAYRRCGIFRALATTTAGNSNLLDPAITVSGVSGQLFLNGPNLLGAVMLDATGIGNFNLGATNSAADAGKTYLLQVLCAGGAGSTNEYLRGWTAYSPLS